jgi:hypothetical protein
MQIICKMLIFNELLAFYLTAAANRGRVDAPVLMGWPGIRFAAEEASRRASTRQAESLRLEP